MGFDWETSQLKWNKHLIPINRYVISLDYPAVRTVLLWRCSCGKRYAESTARAKKNRPNKKLMETIGGYNNEDEAPVACLPKKTSKRALRLALWILSPNRSAEKNSSGGSYSILSKAKRSHEISPNIFNDDSFLPETL